MLPQDAPRAQLTRVLTYLFTETAYSLKHTLVSIYYDIDILKPYDCRIFSAHDDCIYLLEITFCFYFSKSLPVSKNSLTAPWRGSQDLYFVQPFKRRMSHELKTGLK